MADVKWIKLKVGMFDGMSFKKIKKAKIGGESFRDKLTAVWFELMDFAGRCNHDGAFISPREIPFKELSDIAVIIDRDEEELQLCMSFFINEGMVSVVDDVYMLSNWSEYQNIEGLERIREQTRKRVAKHRENQKLLLGSYVCQYCGGIATGEDHIVATARGGSDTEDNKVPCCKDCNRIKNDKPLVDFLNANRSRIRDDLVTKNEKLQRFVTLCNVTDCYIVTEGNATDIEEDKEEDKEIYISIVEYLNEKANTNYKPSSKKTRTLIHARISEGFTVDDFKKVIDNKCADWLGSEFEKFLRPETLFGTKFESYLNTPTKKPNKSKLPFDESKYTL